MSGSRLSALFDRLVELPRVLRDAELSALDADTRERLQCLLDAHERPDHALSDVVGHAALAASPAGTPGMRLGPWRLLREIGAGGMGTVFLAERADAQFEQQAAIKLIRGFPTEDGRRRLRQERQILAELDHPNIARLLDGGETEQGQPYLAMEFVSGIAVTDYVGARALDLSARLVLFDRILAAVQHAHERLVIHRDIKPGNVLVRDDGEPKLLDFGVAKLLDLSSGSDETSTRVWTPGYASPEQRAGRAVGVATDVYGLGVLLRELLTGERPDGRVNTGAAAALVPDAELRGVLEMACAEQPSQRYATVEALREDLRRYREGRPLRAARDSGWYRARKFAGRHRLGVALAIAIATGLAGFVWRLDAERSRALVAERAAQAARLRAEGEAALAHQTMRYVTSIFEAASPDNALGKALTARELVDYGREQLARELGEQPTLQRHVQRILGSLYLNLGDAAVAAAQLQAGLAQAAPQDRADALDTAASYDALGNALTRLDRNAEAMTAFQAASELRQRFAPDDVAERLKSLDNLSYGYFSSGDNAKAEALMREGLALAEQHPELPSDSFQEIATTLGSLYVQERELDQAAALSEQAYAMVAKRRAPGHPDFIPVLRLRARVSQESGDYVAAEAALRDALALQEHVVGGSGTQLASLISDYGTVLNDLGRYREAAAAFDRAVALEQAAGVTGGLNDAVNLNNVASVFEIAGDYERAAELFERCVAIVSRERAPLDVNRRKFESNFARTLLLKGERKKARGMLLDVVARDEAADGRESYPYAWDSLRLAILERLDGDNTEARKHVLIAQPVLAELLPPEHPAQAQVQRQLGRIALAEGDLAQADKHIAAALALLEGARGGTHPDTAVARSELAAVRHAQGRDAEARALLDQAIPVMRAAFLASEINRRFAEDLARTLGMATAP